ncbi:hypothetical protein HID58_060284 [Brassica napus]|uniref:ELK domain-containing protein n=1 Tax=Brassica napus TaxID=3708 RepID=A0ABQ7ZVJ0_BRANA|nr:hypothetical protein HID58_060284 [Brassica napus]
MHKHGTGPRCFLSIEYKMMVDEGLDEPPSYTALARKTHTGKDGSFLDERTEELVLEVEEAVEQMLQDGSPLGDSQTDSTAASNAKCYLLNQEYIKRGKTKKGTVYGLGSVQYKNSSASVPIPVSLKRNLDVDMRMSDFETTISEVKEDIAGVKEDFSALKTEINAFKTEVAGEGGGGMLFCKTLQSQASTPASTAQPFQPQAQSQPQGQPQAPVQSQHQPQPQVQSTAPPQHLTTNNQSDIDRWRQELGYGETAIDRNNNGSSEEEVDMNNEFIDPQAEDRELKGQLLRKYSGYLGSLKQEFMKKRKKGKLPKEARQQVLDWWSRHYKWPYPPHE